MLTMGTQVFILIAKSIFSTKCHQCLGTNNTSPGFNVTTIAPSIAI